MSEQKNLKVLEWLGTGRPYTAQDLLRDKGIIYQQTKEKTNES